MVGLWACVLLCVLAVDAAAENIDAGKARAVMCTACHGISGIGVSDYWPNLAGQKKGYLIKQIKAFRDGVRVDPAMSPMAVHLSDQDVADIAAYYSSLDSSPSNSAESFSNSNGTKVYKFPKIEGTISTDKTSIEAESTDFGGYTKAIPQVVVKPKTIADIAIVVRWANENNLPITPRGTGHTTDGASLSEGGIILKTELLTKVRTLSNGLVEAEAGARVFEVAIEADKSDMHLPASAGFVAQTVGGVLSVGGYFLGAPTEGLMIDHVEELTVVTGAGEIVVCSLDKNPKLFNAALGGLGQFGVIAKAVFKVTPRKKYIHEYYAEYPDVESLIQEMKDSANDKRFHAMDGYTWRDGKAVILLEKVVWSDSPTPFEASDVFSSRNNVVKGSTKFKHTFGYLDYVQRGNVLHGLMGQGLFPWIDVVFPKDRSVEFFKYFAKIVPKDLISGPQDFLSINVIRKKREHQYSIQQLPVTKEGDIYFAASFSPMFKTPEEVERFKEIDKKLLKFAMDLGGKTYVINGLPKDQAQWKQHFGDNWEKVMEAKKEFDPNGIMSTGLPGLTWE
tara:strand:- start:4650 stop:6338 length:1689 start_codon:yes stop_codon:yes gene_type:complete